MRLCRIKAAAAAMTLSLAAAAVADGDFDLARQALRDGLWEVARAHATKSSSPDAGNAILESYARESRWDDILNAVKDMGQTPGDGALYFKALAETMKGDGALAIETLSAIGTGDSPYSERVPLLKTCAMLAKGDVTGALALTAENSFVSGDIDSRIAAARVYDAANMKAKSEEAWQSVMSDPAADETQLSAAAAALGDEESLKKAYEKAVSPRLRRPLALALGMAAVKNGKDFDEGAKMITLAVCDSPDTPGAMETFLFLADAYMERKEWEKASSALKQAIEAWPAAAKLASVQHALAWAYRKQGKTDEALEVYSKLAEMSNGDDERASVFMEQGDLLAETGRGAESLAKYKMVLEKYPSSPAAAKLKSVVEMKEMESDGYDLFGNFKFREAASVFSEIGRKDPSKKERMDYMTMLCFYGQGLDAEASRKAKDLAAGANDKSIRAEATLWLAKFFYNARQWRDSCDLFEEYAVKLASGSPGAPSALLWAARAAFAGNEFQRAIDLVTRLAKDSPDSPERPSGFLIQGEALVELSRLDEAAVIFDGVVSDPKASAADRARARMLRADSLFVLGADNPARYREALEAYRTLQMGEELDPGMKLVIAFKIARTLEKLGKTDDAIDHYYCDVVCAYRDGRARGLVYGDEAKATFARAVFLLADELESRGDIAQAERILRLVIKSDVLPAVKEAKNRRERLQKKGLLQ